MERASRAPELLPFLRQEPEYLWKENPLPKLLKVKPPMNTEQPSRNQTICLAVSLRPSRLSGESAVRN